MDFGALLQDELATYERNEWSGKLGETPVKLFARPVTADDVIHVAKLHPNFGQGITEHGAMVEMIIRKTETEDGTKAFKAGEHRNKLLRLKAGRITDMYVGLFAGQLQDGATEEELEKN